MTRTKNANTSGWDWVDGKERTAVGLAWRGDGWDTEDQVGFARITWRTT